MGARGLFSCFGGSTKKQVKRPLAPILWTVHCSRHDIWNLQNFYMLFETHLGIFATKKKFWTLLSSFRKLEMTLEVKFLNQNLNPLEYNLFKPVHSCHKVL